MAILGIEIGGTKLQLGLSDDPRREPFELRRRNIDPRRGAQGILDQISAELVSLQVSHRIEAIGVGFGGPVNPRAGTVTVSHQIAGWDQFPLCDWLRDRCDVPVALGNDCDVAALAEARYGAGRDVGTVFYVTVGTGIGGGFVEHGQVYGTQRPAAAEIGHLRPGLDCDSRTVEDCASGWGIANAARRAMTSGPHSEATAALLSACSGQPEALTAKDVAAAARQQNAIAVRVLHEAVNVLGWAIAQMITLLAPERVVIGGGVAQLESELFWQPLAAAVDRHGFAPLRGSCELRPALLGETVVVRGAVALVRAAQQRGDGV